MQMILQSLGKIEKINISDIIHVQDDLNQVIHWSLKNDAKEGYMYNVYLRYSTIR